MRNWLLKLVILIWVGFTGYWLLPLKKPNSYREDSAVNTVLATQQFCDNQCADIIIKKGKIEIPDSMQRAYPEIRTDVAMVTGNSPFKKSKSALFFSYDFIVNGYVQDVEFVPNEGIVPVYYIDEWYPTQYIARFWKLTGNWEILYLINLNLGLPLLLLLIYRQNAKSDS